MNLTPEELSKPCPFCSTMLTFDKMPLAMRVAVRRNQLGITQEQLATLVGQGRTTIANIETGRHKIGFDLLRTYANALQLSIDELVP